MASIQMRLYGYTRDLDFAASKMLLSADMYPGVRRAARGAIMLPTKSERWALLRSPHIFKKAQEHFERKTHKRLIVVRADSVAQANSWLEMAARTMPPGINVKATVIAEEDLGSLYRPPTLDGSLLGDLESVPASVVQRDRQLEAAHFVFRGVKHLEEAPQLVRQRVEISKLINEFLDQPFQLEMPYSPNPNEDSDDEDLDLAAGDDELDGYDTDEAMERIEDEFKADMERDDDDEEGEVEGESEATQKKAAVSHEDTLEEGQVRVRDMITPEELAANEAARARDSRTLRSSVPLEVEKIQHLIDEVVSSPSSAAAAEDEDRHPVTDLMHLLESIRQDSQDRTQLGAKTVEQMYRQFRAGKTDFSTLHAVLNKSESVSAPTVNKLIKTYCEDAGLSESAIFGKK